MAEKQATVTYETVLTKITIDPVGAQMYLEGIVRIKETGTIVSTHTQNVTDLLTPQQYQSAVDLAVAAGAWIDSKMP